MIKKMSLIFFFVCSIFTFIPCSQAATENVPAKPHVMGAISQKIINEHPDWIACTTDDDCTSVSLSCAQWQAANKAHIEEVRTNYEQKCFASPLPTPQPDSKCIEHICVDIPKTGESASPLKLLDRE